MKKRAFTLVEIMIVVALIGLLATLIVPAALKARENARRSKCANNLRLVGTALQVYASDNKEQFPQDGTQDGGKILGLLYPDYIDTLKAFVCPSDTQDNFPTVDGDGFLVNYSYAYDDTLKATANSQTPIACDKGINAAGTALTSASSHYPAGLTVLFVGGNVAWVRASGDTAALPSTVEGEPVTWTELED